MIHFELISMYDMRHRKLHSFACGYPDVPASFAEKTIELPFCSPCQKSEPDFRKTETELSILASCSLLSPPLFSENFSLIEKWACLRSIKYYSTIQRFSLISHRNQKRLLLLSYLPNLLACPYLYSSSLPSLLLQWVNRTWSSLGSTLVLVLWISFSFSHSITVF